MYMHRYPSGEGIRLIHVNAGGSIPSLCTISLYNTTVVWLTCNRFMAVRIRLKALYKKKKGEKDMLLRLRLTTLQLNIMRP